MTLTIGVDVGGTKVAAVLIEVPQPGQIIGDDALVVARSVEPTASQSYESLAAAVVAAAGTLVQQARQKRPEQSSVAVGVAVAGNVSADRSHLEASPHLPVAGRPLRDDLERGLRQPVILDNDANAAAWAEAHHGGHDDRDDLFMLTVGTGLGGGVILGGQLQRGAHGFAGEAGHVPLVPDGRPCECGGHGCWEQYASGSALVRDFQARGGDPSWIGSQVTDAARHGDPLAVAAFNEIGCWLGFGLAGVIALLDPAVVVLGGGVSEAGDLVLTPTRRSLEVSLGWQGQRLAPPIRPARWGNDAGAIGAALLAAPPTASSRG